MNYEISGLPLHVLLVHAAIVMVPLAALCTALSVLWPAARRRLGVLPPVIALLALVLTAFTVQAGLWLFARVGVTPLIRSHARLGGTLLPWVGGVFVLSLMQWLWSRQEASVTALARTRLGKAGYRIAAALIAVAVLGVCAGALADVAMIGEAGSRAVWEGNFSPTPVNRR
jgi:hypothetical protein